MSFTMPNQISNGASRDARPVQANFTAITSALQNDYLRADGSIAADAPISASAVPTAAGHLVNKAYADALIPVGVVVPYAGPTAPAGWALAVGQLVSKADNPLLWALLGSTYGAATGTQFYLPDLRSRFIAGKGTATWSDALNEVGGSKDAVVVDHNHPHTITASQGTHAHAARVARSIITTDTGNPSGTMASPTYPGAQSESNVAVTVDAASAGAITISGGVSNAGVAGTDKNLPPYITLNHIIRLG